MHDLYTFVDVDSRESAAAKIREVGEALGTYGRPRLNERLVSQHLRLYANLSATRMILLGSSRVSW